MMFKIFRMPVVELDGCRRNAIVIQPCPQHVSAWSLEKRSGAIAITRMIDCDQEDSYLMLWFSERPADSLIEMIADFLSKEESDG